MDLRAVVIVNDADRAIPLRERLLERGFDAVIETDREDFLLKCRVDPPLLAIVEDQVNGMTASRFISELLAIAWTTGAILICDEEEEAVHRRTEGLGILGHMRSCEDFDSLHKLMDRFCEILSQNE